VPQCSDDDFEELLRATQAGDERAAGELFDRYQPMVLRFLRGTEPRVAEDLAGEVWVAVATGIGAFEGEESGFRSWIFTIARRRVMDHRRRGVRRRTEPTDPEALSRAVDHANAAPDALDDYLERDGAQQAVADLVHHLTLDQAEVVLLRVVADLDVPAVAEVLGKTENWVRVTQHRALRRLARRLGTKFAVTE
jgi:RNA polymerase sigma-70 factor (ECF subfamily)